MVSALVAIEARHLHQIDVIDLYRVAFEILIQPRQLHQSFRKIPDAQELVAEQRMKVVDYMVEADRIREQFIVVFGVGQNRQHADLMHQSTQRRLIRLELGITTTQRITDPGDFQALAPDFAHFLFHHFGTGVENLLHHQADRQVTAVVDAQAGDGGMQVGDFLRRAQQRAVDHFDQARRQRRVTADDFAQLADADFRIFSSLANLQGYFRQCWQNQLIFIDGLNQILLDLIRQFVHLGSLGCCNKCCDQRWISRSRSSS